MADGDITQVHVGNVRVGIIGLGRLMEQMAVTHANNSDEEIRVEKKSPATKLFEPRRFL